MTNRIVQLIQLPKLVGLIYLIVWTAIAGARLAYHLLWFGLFGTYKVLVLKAEEFKERVKKLTKEPIR